MKKILLILAIALIGCSKDEVNECQCDIKVIIVDGTEGIIGQYTIENAPSDCEGKVDWETIRQDKPSNHWFNGTTNCN